MTARCGRRWIRRRRPPMLEGGKDGEMRQAFLNQQDAPPCPDCGCIMVRNGACYKCMNCGSTSGCS